MGKVNLPRRSTIFSIFKTCLWPRDKLTCPLLDLVEFPRQSEALYLGRENSGRKGKDDIENHGAKKFFLLILAIRQEGPNRPLLHHNEPCQLHRVAEHPPPEG
jgi:hypothetical protein